MNNCFPVWETIVRNVGAAPYRVVYEDAALLVCAKRAGVPVQSRSFRTPDLESMLRTYLAQKGASYLGLVHRLDQPVCGLLVFAKTKEAAAALCAQVQNGGMQKTYMAVCAAAQADARAAQTDPYMQVRKSGARTQAGQSVWEDGKTVGSRITLTDYLLRDGRTNRSTVVPAQEKNAKRAVLTCEVLEVSQEGAESRALLRIRLHTGRHHQIRVQLAHAGWPIVGDQKYGAGAAGEQLLLCAYQLAFVHPQTGKQMQFDLLIQGETGCE